MLHDHVYFQSKSQNHNSISDFYDMVDIRTKETVENNQRKAFIMRSVFIFFLDSVYLLRSGKFTFPCKER